MIKKISIMAMALAFTAATLTVAYSFTCEVTKIEGDAVTIKCDTKKVETLEVGNDVKVSIKKDKKAVEGC